MTRNATVTIKEHLNRNWHNALVRIEGDFADVAALRGPDGLLAAERTNNGLRCIIDLPALAEQTYEVVATCDTPPTTDLRVSQESDRVTIATSSLTAVFPLGDTMQTPILALRTAEGIELGPARFFGTHTVTSFRSELISEGPVCGEVQMCWSYADGVTVTLLAQIAAGDSRILWDMNVEGDAVDAGWDLPLDPLGRLLLAGVGGKVFNFWGVPRGESGLADPAICGTGLVLNLSPWADWWDEQAHPFWQFVTPDEKPTFSLKAHDVGSWVVPESIGTHASWEAMFHKYLPVLRDADGNLRVHVTSPQGRRCWLMGPAGPQVGRALDRALHEVLDWPDNGRHPHPILYLRDIDLDAKRVGLDDPRIQDWLKDADKDLDAPYTYGGISDGKDTLQNRTDEKAMAAWLLTGSPDIAEKMHLVQRLRNRLDRFETKDELDWMRYVPNVVHFYDIVMGSGLLSDADRQLFRSQMAHLGYLMAHPSTWSMERGYCSRNPNMSVAYNLNLGMIACVLPDHPEAPNWMHRALVMLRKFLEQHKGEKGEWSESLHYTHVSMNNVILFAIAARDAGFCDLLEEGVIKRIMTVCAKMHSPPEKRGAPLQGGQAAAGTRHAGVRGLAPWGRAAITGQSFGHYAQLARATVHSDPAFSRLMQWMYRETGYNETTGNANFEMYKDVYFDRSLPAEAPDWHSEAFRGASLMRRALAKPHEHFLLLESGAPFTMPGEQSGIMLYFERGTPLVSRFSGGYDERAEQLISRVSKAHARGPEQPAHRWCDSGWTRAASFATLPTLDYAELEGAIGAPSKWVHEFPPELPPWPQPLREASDAGVLQWRRRLMNLRYNLASENAGYLVLHDTVQGGEPSEWKLWMLSEKIGTPEETADRDRFLSDAPGDATCPPRTLHGNRFTAVGSYGLDMELYVAAPLDTPRHTLRYSRNYGTVKKSLRGFVESHDLLHLQLADAGHYFVIVFPRRPGEAPPRFETLADGKAVQVEADFGRDIILLGDEPSSIRVDKDIHLSGTAASLQLRSDGTRLVLGSGGCVRYGAFAVSSDRAASIHIEQEALTVHLSPERREQVVTVQAPGEWEIVEEPVDERPVDLVPVPGGFRLTAQSNSNRMRLKRRH